MDSALELNSARAFSVMLYLAETMDDRDRFALLSKLLALTPCAPVGFKSNLNYTPLTAELPSLCMCIK